MFSELHQNLETGVTHSHPLHIAAACALGLGLLCPSTARAETITVFAASSLTTALTEIETNFEAASGHDLVIALAGSSALARQIQQGAPADIFLSASPDWMDVLETEGLIEPDARFDLLGNRLVLVSHGDAPPIEIGPDLDLMALLGDGRLAMALVDSVPAGIYGKQALVSLGLWDAVADKVAQADNVRAALALVSSGEAPLGIVYRTDAASDPAVRIVGAFPADSHPAIIYPMALLSTSTNPDAQAFVDYLKSPAAKPFFERQGFAVLN